MTSLVLGGGGAEAAYTVDQSCRFNDNDSAYLNKTFGSAGNRKTWTYSCWVKRGNMVNGNLLWTSDAWMQFWNDTVYNEFGGGSIYQYSNNLLRDPAAWYHIVWKVDTTGSPTSQMFVNGTEISYATNNAPASDAESNIGNASEHRIGGTTYLDGYLAEVYFIDGTALDPSSFAETDSDTNQWKPIDASGLTFGTNGFYLKFQDSAALGDDSSGNTNDFTPTNLVATDQMVDSPTNNFSTYNPLLKSYLASTFSEGNLKVVAGSGWVAVPATFSVVSGKWYMEFVPTTTNSRFYVVGDNSSKWFDDGINPQEGDSAIGYSSDGDKQIDNTATSYGATWVSGDIIAIALNMDDSEVTFYKNNATQGTISFSGNITSASSVIPFALGAWYGDTWTYANFGADSSFAGLKTAQGNQDGNSVGDFYYEPPSGFLALCTSNLPDPEIKLPGENFNTVLYTGDGATTLAVTGAGLAPDFTWIKNRDAADSSVIVDAVRGANNYIVSDSTAAEVDDSTFVASLDSDGFTVGNDVAVNTNTENYASWNWLAGGTPTATNVATTGVMTSGSVFQNGVSNTSFTPGSTIYPDKISASTTNGFSTIQWVGNGANSTVAHGLSVTPELIIIKPLDRASDWVVYSEPVGPTAAMQLNIDNDPYTYAAYFNNTAPTASVFSLGEYSGVNASGEDFIAYCFHSVEGYSRVGSYTGNGNDDGTFIYTGMRPAFTITKRYDANEDWWLEDDKRNTYNPQSELLYADVANAEATEINKDYVSNGIKLRLNNANWNADGGTYLYYAIAAYPFKYSPAR